MFSFVSTRYETLRFCATDTGQFEQDGGPKVLARQWQGVYTTQP